MKRLRFALPSRCSRGLRDARSGAAGRAGRHWLSASPFRLRPNYGVPSGLSGDPAPACRAAARRGRKLNALLAALLFTASGAAQAKSITALTPSFSNVTKAIGSAVDGDMVIIPAGKASWTQSLAITKAITLMGQTTTNSVAGTANDQTILQYNLTDTRPLISVMSVAGKAYRISGITFQSTSNFRCNNGFVGLGGYSQTVRLDHCHFALATSPAPAQGIRVTGAVRGVADHNVIEQGHTQTFGVYNGGSPNETFGNTAWSQPTAWGSPDFFYVEDNYIKKTGKVTGVCDGDAGMKLVLRHNHLYNLHIANHGTEGVARGGRALEIYNNDFHNTDTENTVGAVRSGGVLFYNNTYSGNAIIGGLSLAVYRTKNTWPNQQFTGWEGASGRCPWDANDTEGNGTYMEGHAPFQYFPASGSATAGTGTTPTKIVDSGNPGWATDKWKTLYGIYHVEDGRHNQILDTINGNTNTAIDTATFTSNSAMTWAPGSRYQIYRCLVALDQESRGQGDLVTGSPGSFINSVTGRRSWPHQKLEPVYSWNNHHSSGASIGVQSGYPTMLENRDWYNQAAAVNGVQRTGVGVGTLVQRPARGVAGVDVAHVTTNPPGTAYWATDVPSINGSTDKGALYVWRGSAWVLYYRPYTYPHPLAFPQ